MDPGLTNGWALYYRDQDVIHQDELTFEELVRNLDRWLSTAAASTVLGCERFIITPQSSRRQGSTEAIKAWGAVQAAAVRHLPHQFVDSQTSSTALPFCRDSTLRALGWYRTTMPHANDAARHVYRFLAGEGLLTEDQRSKMFSD